MLGDALANRITRYVEDNAEMLLSVSHAIHERPELAFEERFACETLVSAANAAGLNTQANVFGLETAFEGSFGADDGPTAAILAEYDALPGIGHACGHNLIATSALGAALALHSIGGELPGRVRFIGTPAEERGGGKELMARNGAFEGVDAAMMIHPSGVNLATMPCISIAEVSVTYHGRSAHASAMPHKGVNALDGLLLAYQAISNLRQHIRDNERIHGIITEGGQAPNIVPDKASGDFYVRAANEKALEALKPRVQACFEAGATGSGCEVDVKWAGVDYLDLNTNWPLAERFQVHAESLGRDFIPMEKLAGAGMGSTDMGNVSYRVPSIHPMLASAPRNVVIHHPDFAEWAGSEMGDAAALDGAKSLALTAADFLLSPELQTQSRKAFELSTGLAI
ncbi:MAG: M20 family metallopeptidase [Pseudomonadaceae bacterium]|nr:M20 family metallopeptidase [Pseudomonadaceae bacterium]